MSNLLKISVAATQKLNNEVKEFKGDEKARAIHKHVANTFTNFIQENEQFAYVFLNTTRTLSNCCQEIMKGVGKSISDIEVYRRAVKFYFPDSEISFHMEIRTGEMPDEKTLKKVSKEVTKNAPKQKKVLEQTNTKTENKQKNSTNPMQLTLF